MSAEEMVDTVDMVATDPAGGDLIVGSGGCRKVRVAGKGRGKSGGYRVITYYVSSYGVFLLWVLSKGGTANLTKAQVNQLAALTSKLP